MTPVEKILDDDVRRFYQRPRYIAAASISGRVRRWPCCGWSTDRARLAVPGAAGIAESRRRRPGGIDPDHVGAEDRRGIMVQNGPAMKCVKSTNAQISQWSLDGNVAHLVDSFQNGSITRLRAVRGAASAGSRAS